MAFGVSSNSSRKILACQVNVLYELFQVKRHNYNSGELYRELYINFLL